MTANVFQQGKGEVNSMKRWVACTVSALLIFAFPMATLAQDSAPTDTFTHWTLSSGQKVPVATQPLYETVEVVTARSLGLEKSFGVIQSIDCDEQGNTYILTDGGRILCFNSEYVLKRDYVITDSKGDAVDFSGAKGIYVYSSTELYIADTSHNRVLHCVDGVVRQEIVLPKTALIPKDFVFKPTRVARDAKGFLYVLCEGSYHGAILYSPDGEFSGFFGANTVKGTILSSMGYLWDRLTMNDIKRAQVSKTLPYQFSDICVDEHGFVYTCTGLNASDSVGQIRMLSPGGDGILSGAESFNFGESDHVTRLEAEIRQNFIGIQTDGEGLIFALDNAFGLIYIYDTDGHMIAAFGGGVGQGRQTGVFSSACSIALSGSRLMVADSIRGSVTVFERTAYGDTLCRAQKLTLNSDYTDAKPLWESVLKQDPVNRMALLGLAKAAYQEGNYPKAMQYAKACGDSQTYSQARTKIQNAFISQNYAWLFSLIILLVGGMVALLIFTVKRQVVLIRNDKLRTLARAPIHPFQSFSDIKYKQMGSFRIALVLTALFYFSSAAASIWSDFRYTSYDTASYNPLFQIVQTVGLVLIWSVSNWGISTLQEGKGRLKEVFTVTAYSTLPMILYNVIATPLTHVVASADSTLISGLHTLALIFCGIMLTIGLMTIHSFSFPRFLVTAFISLLFIILIVFVLFMIGILLTQFGGFFVDIVLEAMRRW